MIISFSSQDVMAERQFIPKGICFFSPQLRKIIRVQEGTRQTAVRRLWIYIKQKNLFVPGEPSYFLPDEALRPIFGSEKVPIFAMNRYLARHVF